MQDSKSPIPTASPLKAIGNKEGLFYMSGDILREPLLYAQTPMQDLIGKSY